MLAKLFVGIFDSDIKNVIPLSDFLICIGSSLAIGLILAAFYMYDPRCTRSFAAALALLPSVVCVVIMTVNGNVGAGVAVAGAFSLVRFRSAPGSAREIGAIFLAMATGLILGMGYIGYAFICAVVLGFAGAFYSRIGLGKRKDAGLYKTLHITIPEDLDYNDVFEPIIKEYSDEYELVNVKTTNMGSLFKLTYDLKLNSSGKEKEMIDKLRCRNGNLEINISKQETAISEL